MATPKLKLKINFPEMFGVPVKDASLRQAIGGAVIETIVNRTQDGISLGGRPFKKYSKNYVNSLAFKVHGKSEGNVDLTLSGDMLSAIEVLEESDNGLLIGFDNTLDNDKAYNHNVGDTLPKREFFGLQKQELEYITNEFAELVSDTNDMKEAKTKDEFTDIATRTIAKLLAENELE
jgi:hypothetical protein